MIFVTGDKHGELSIKNLGTKKFSIGKTLTKNDYVIIAGDFGLIFNNVQSKDEKYHIKWLTEKPWTTLFVDGNHENHPLLLDLPTTEMFGGCVGIVNDSIYHLRRGEVYIIDNKKFFTFGGASSHDKLTRREHIDWWKEELPTYGECENGLANLEKHGNKVDYIITHTCPTDIIYDLCFLTWKNFADRIDKISNYFDVIQETADFKRWYFGHFHEDLEVNKKFHCLYHSIQQIV